MREQRDRKKSTDHYVCDSDVIPRNGSVDSNRHKIEPIILDHGEGHISQIVTREMRTVGQHKADIARYLPVRVLPRN